MEVVSHVSIVMYTEITYAPNAKHFIWFSRNKGFSEQCFSKQQ